MKKSKNNKINPDLDEQSEGISYEKGRQFEEQFALYMKEKLGWNKIRVGAHMPGGYNVKGTSIDILGERLNEKGEKYRKICLNIMYGTGISCGLLFFLLKNQMAWNILCSINSLFFLVGLVFYFLSKHNNKQNAWVECKNLQTKATINHITKMIREYEDYKKSKNETHKFTHLYFVSANGFVENALKMAHDNNIICYSKGRSYFNEEKYWK